MRPNLAGCCALLSRVQHSLPVHHGGDHRDPGHPALTLPSCLSNEALRYLLGIV